MVVPAVAHLAKERLLFPKKKKQKDFLFHPAFEWPDLGPSKAGGNKSFLGYFFLKKSNGFLLTYSQGTFL
jgi:hypothetical protein